MLITNCYKNLQKKKNYYIFALDIINYNLKSKIMKKITKFFAFMVVLVASLNFSANAQEYFTDYGTYTRSDRFLNSLEFQRNGTSVLSLEINQGDDTPKNVYFDKTENKIDIYQGAECNIVPSWTGVWMGVAVLVDYDNNKTFDADSYPTAEYVGLSNGAENGVAPVSFTVPADQAIGEYRMRVMIDWVDGSNLPHANAADVPSGNLLPDNGGACIDVILNVIEAPAALPPTFSGVADENGFVLLGDDRFTINSAEGTTLKYTTDGSDPKTSTTAVAVASNTKTLTISAETTEIKAISEVGGVQSEVASFNRIVTEAQLGKEYHVVFQRNGAVSALTTGDPMSLQEYNAGQENQVFVFEKAETDGFYILKAKNGEDLENVGFSDGRFRNPAETAEELRIVQFGTGDNYEIERKNNTDGKAMNPSGGFVNGKEMGEWYNGDPSNEVTFVEVPEFPDVTLSVAIAEGSADFGKVEIVGQTELTVTKKSPIKVKATPNPGYIFVKWSDGTNDYTTFRYTYTGTENITFTATFAKLGTGSGTVLTNENLDGKYFYIQSAGDGEHGNNAGDTRNDVLYANGTDLRLEHALLSTVSKEDYALWFVDEGKLKNKGSELYMTGSRDQDETGEELTVELVEGTTNQYQISTGGQNPTCAWKNNKADRNSALGADSMTAWYLIEHSKNSNDVASIEEQNISITVVNGVVNVLGVDNFEVYTLAGQKVNAKQQLQAGVYIVKVDNAARKVVVK